MGLNDFIRVPHVWQTCTTRLLLTEQAQENLEKSRLHPYRRDVGLIMDEPRVCQPPFTLKFVHQSNLQVAGNHGTCKK